MTYQPLYHPSTLWVPPAHNAHQTFGIPRRRFPDLITIPDPTLGPRAPYTSPEAFLQLHHLLLMASAHDLPRNALNTLPIPLGLVPNPPYLQQQAKRFFSTLPVAIQPQLRPLLAQAAQHPLTPSQSAFLALLSDPLASRRITLPASPLKAPQRPSSQLRWLRPLLALTITRYTRAHSLYLPIPTPPGLRPRFTKTKTPRVAQCPRCSANLILIPAGYAQPAKPLEALCACGVEDATLNLWLDG